MIPASENPFRVERTDTLPYRFEQGSWDSLLHQLEAMRWRAAIVGPHGTGKTTLLEQIVPHLEKRGFEVSTVRLGSSRKQLPSLDGTGFIILDGAEQLSLLAWRRFLRRTRKAEGLLISTHKPGRLPTLLETRGNLETLRELVAQLAPDHPTGDLEKLLERHGGNLRFCLRELYDHVWEE